MPANKNALIRYRRIDQCLCNRNRKWTLPDLIRSCSEALREYEGSPQEVSRRTIQLDLQNLRSGKLGHEAPIVVVDKKYYTYSDPDFSLFDLPISSTELGRLVEVVDLLKQFGGFTQFQEIESIVQKLKDKIAVVRQNRRPVIDLDQGEQTAGLEFIQAAYDGITQKKALSIHYHPFFREVPIRIIIHPYLLKEYNKRWYLVGFSTRRHRITTLALDRFKSCMVIPTEAFIKNNFFNPANYFRDVIGITVNLENPVEEIILKIYPEMIPYVLTKPIHHSQVVLNQQSKFLMVSIRVRINNELLEVIRGMGKHIEVLSPEHLRSQMKIDLEATLNRY